MTIDAREILAGSNDELVLHELYEKIQCPRNPSQAAFMDAWEISTFIASDGFEILFEQQRSIDDFAQALVAIGLPQVLPVFQKVKQVAPDNLLAAGHETALQDHLQRNFSVLKDLFHEYLDLSEPHLLPAFGQYVRDHQTDFADLIQQAESDGAQGSA